MASTRAAWMRRARSGLGRARWSSARAIVMWASMTGQSWSSRTFSEADQMARWKARWASCRATGSGSSTVASYACQAWRRASIRRPDRVADDRLNRQPVEGQPRLGEVADRGGVDLGDTQAPVRLRGEQSLLRQLGERLPYGRAAHLQGGGETDLGQLLAGAQYAQDDAPADLVDHRLAPRDRRRRQQPGTRGRGIRPLDLRLRHARSASMSIV